MKRNLWGVLAACGLLAATPVVAHHSPEAVYAIGQRQSIDGELVQFVYQNPHSLVYVLVPDEHGRPQRWVVEWASSLQLHRQGVGTGTLKIGDHVIITGSPSKTPGDHRLRLRTIARPKDNWKWSGSFQ